ncbi:MAG: DUF2752 domain-containing protein [Acidobacteria bacterium]|nr:DUF2752 domain-containing protein [Acidobacteriota bacterium]
MTRAVYWFLALAAGGVLAVAAGLIPDGNGLGTHTQLGLPACGFRTLTGKACPSCGLTTSFALAVRGRFLDAAAVQPFGFGLFLLCAGSIPALLFAGIRAVPLSRVFQPDRAIRVLQVGGAAYFGAWLYKLYL